MVSLVCILEPVLRASTVHRLHHVFSLGPFYICSRHHAQPCRVAPWPTYLTAHERPATLPGQQKTAAGILLPSSATKNPLPEATVIAVGPGAPNKKGIVIPVSVKAGDRVLLPGWGGNPIKVGEEVSSDVFFDFGDDEKGFVSRFWAVCYGLEGLGHSLLPFRLTS